MKKLTFHYHKLKLNCKSFISRVLNVWCVRALVPRLHINFTHFNHEMSTVSSPNAIPRKVAKAH